MYFEGVILNELGDWDFFKLLLDFYLNILIDDINLLEINIENLDFLMV